MAVNAQRCFLLDRSRLQSLSYRNDNVCLNQLNCYLDLLANSRYEHGIVDCQSREKGEEREESGNPSRGTKQYCFPTEIQTIDQNILHFDGCFCLLFINVTTDLRGKLIRSSVFREGGHLAVVRLSVVGTSFRKIVFTYDENGE